MVTIMQEHGEVVLCVGSSTNMQNVPIFLKADCRYVLFLTMILYKTVTYLNPSPNDKF